MTAEISDVVPLDAPAAPVLAAAVLPAAVASDAVAERPTRDRTVSLLAHREAKLTALLEAAASVIQEVGHKQLTLALVVERADSSSRTVYRYFPDRLAVLQALAERNVDSFRTGWLAQSAPDDATTWVDGIQSFIGWFFTAFRDLPGFRSLRFGDLLDVRPRPTEPTGLILVAAEVAALLATRYDLTLDEFGYRVEIALTLADALLARAFALDSDGDADLLSDARLIPVDYLIAEYGDPRH